MTGARYGALGVLNHDHTALDQFLTVGLHPDEEEKIGTRPTGQGVLGLLITAPHPVRLANLGLNPFLSMFTGAILVGVVSLPISTFMLRLKTSEFAIGMWVIAELAHLLVNLDGLINGETGTSFIELNQYDADLRHMLIYWSALAAMVALLGIVFLLLRSRFGVSIQAIRDNEDAAASVGVKVLITKRIVFVLAAAGAAAAGALWVANAITFQPQSYFSVQWTAYMIFMVLVGGIGTFEGAIVGAVIFFLIETWFGATGVWYLIGLGATAMIFALFLPRGIWGSLEDRFGIRLLPVGYRLRWADAANSAGTPAESCNPQSAETSEARAVSGDS